MSSKIWLINIVLAVAVVFLGIRACRVWSTWEQVPVASGSSQKPLPLGEKQVSLRVAPPETEYEVVVSSNLLSPTRDEVGADPPTPQNEAKAEEVKATGNLLKVLERAHQQMNLYGVVIVDNEREALIDLVPAKLGPSTPQPSVERARVGDTLGMFKVKEIGPTAVVLTGGGYEWQLALFDKDKPKKRVPVQKTVGPVLIGDVPKIEEGGRATEKKDVKKDEEAAQKEALKKALDLRKSPPALPGETPEAKSEGSQMPTPRRRE